MYGVLRDPGWGDDKVDTRRLPVGEGWGGVAAAVIAAGALVWVIEDFRRALVAAGLLLMVGIGLTLLARLVPLRIWFPLWYLMPAFVGLAGIAYGAVHGAWLLVAFYAVVLGPTVVLRIATVVFYFRRPELFAEDVSPA